MPAGRFVVPAELLAADEVELPAAVAHQARVVLRLAPGDAVTLLDGAGHESTATLLEVGRRRVVVRLGALRTVSQAELPIAISLYQGALKAARFEWVLQKGTELGVSTFIPLLSDRATAGSETTGQDKLARWRRLLDEATEQCGGARVPQLAAPCRLGRALANLPAGALALIPWEGEHSLTMRSAVAGHAQNAQNAQNAQHMSSPPAAAHLFIGPEGGFSADEVALAARHGCVPVTLGPRILRAETAALVATTLLLEACGALG